MFRTPLLAAAVAFTTTFGASADEPPQPVEVVAGGIKSNPLKSDQFVVTVTEEGHPTDRAVRVPATAKVRFGPKPAALADLRAGMLVELAYRGNSADLLEVRARWPQQEVVVKAADPATKTFRIDTAGAETVLALDPAAKVTVDELPAGLADVPVGREARVELSIDKTGALAVEADGPPDTLPGLVKRYDSATRTLLVEVRAAGFRADRVVAVGFVLAPHVKVRHAGRDAAPTDLKERMPVRLAFGPDRLTVTSVLAADPLPPEVNDDD